MLLNYIYIMIGGALGSGARYSISLVPLMNSATATLCVNSFGSFAIGILYSLFSHKNMLEHPYALFLMTGVLGGFTTFSAFSLDAWRLFEQQDYLASAKYIFLTLLLSFFGVIAGVSLTKFLIKGL